MLRIERGTGLFPFLAVLVGIFDTLYAGRIFVLRGIGRYYRSHMYEEPQKCILRYGSEYYLLAAMGIGILLIYMATLVPAAAENSIIQQFLQGDFSQRFALWKWLQ